MKLANWIILAAAAVGSGAVISTRAATIPSGNAANVQATTQSLRADVDALRTAIQSQDKAAAVTAFQKVLEDFRALPSAVRQRIVKNNPALAKIVETIKTLHTDAAAIKTARESHKHAAVASAIAKLKADLAATPPGLRMVIVATHPALAKLVG